QQSHRGNRRRHSARQEGPRPRAAGGGSWLSPAAYKEAMLRASDFEFRNRFWIFGGLFTLAFSAFWIWHLPTAWVIAGEHGRRVLAGGAVLVARGALLRTWAAAYLRSSVVHDGSLHSDRLVADGPYRRLRNPLYLGTLALMIGFGLMAPPAGTAVL